MKLRLTVSGRWSHTFAAPAPESLGGKTALEPARRAPSPGPPRSPLHECSVARTQADDGAGGGPDLAGLADLRHRRRSRRAQIVSGSIILAPVGVFQELTRRAIPGRTPTALAASPPGAAGHLPRAVPSDAARSSSNESWRSSSLKLRSADRQRPVRASLKHDLLRAVRVLGVQPCRPASAVCLAASASHRAASVAWRGARSSSSMPAGPPVPRKHLRRRKTAGRGAEGGAFWHP